MSNACNILYISPFFFPELISTGKYNTYLVNALVESGCNLEVICSHPLYPKWKPEVSNKTLDNVKIIRGGQFIRYPKKPLLRRLILEIWMLFFVFRQLVIFRKQYDSIIIVFPPNLVALLIPLLRSKNTHVIGVVHDIQGVMADPKMGLISSIIMKGIHVIESYSYKICNNLIFLSENMKSAARQLYSISENKTIVRYPFVTIDTKDSKYKLDAIFSGIKSSVVYSGALGEKQAPDKLIPIFIKLLESDPDVHAFIFSQGIVFDRIKSEYTHERLHFHPLVDEDLLPELIKRSTIQVIPQDMGTSEGAFPSKLPNILAAGTKLFCITDKGGEIDNLLSDYSRSVLCYSWENVEESLLNFLQADLQDLSEKDKALLDKFSLSSLVDSIIAMSSQRDEYSDVASKGTQNT
jgi:glycosyltransferase involved in cell wall biosynthesis